MGNIDKLIEAIQDKKVISFEYNKPGKTSGIRIGNPYAIYIFTAKSGKQSTKVHIVQTDGVSDTKDINPFPEFRTFDIQYLNNIIIKNDTFKPTNPKYNPEWEGYDEVIAKV